MIYILIIFFSSLTLAVMAMGFSPGCFNLVGTKVAVSGVLGSLLGLYFCLVLLLIYLGRKLAAFTFKKVLAVKSFLKARVSWTVFMGVSMCVFVCGAGVAGISIMCGGTGLGPFKFVLMKVGVFFFYVGWGLALLPVGVIMFVAWVFSEWFKD